MSKDPKKDTDESKPKNKKFAHNDKQKRRFFLSKFTQEELINWGLEMEEYIKEANGKIIDLRKQLKVLEEKLNRYEPKEGRTADYSGYKSDWPHNKKAQFILQRNFGSLSGTQILKEWFELEPVYRQLWRDPLNCLCKILDRACKNKLIEKFKVPGSSSFFYKIPEN